MPLKKCPPGFSPRKSFTRTNGTHVKASCRKSRSHAGKSPAKAKSHKKAKSAPHEQHWVKGYTRKDGVKVSGHYSKNPHRA